MTKEQALERAISQLGQTEKPLGSNWGEPVRTYLASVGINFPASWCMAFIYWCFDPNINLIKTGGVLHQWEGINSKFKSKTAVPGSIFIMDFGHGLGHTGIVESIQEDWIHTIEGNSNDTGSREGTTVVRKKRLTSKMKGFITLP